MRATVRGCVVSVCVVAGAVPAWPAALATPTPSASLSTALPALDRAAIKQIAFDEAKKAGLPFSLVDAVMKIESDYRPDRIGDVGEIGLMQVRPATAAMLGFRGTDVELADPAINIHYGATYLGIAWRLAAGDVCRTLMKYRAGHGNETMSLLSVAYCQRAQVHLASVGSPLAAMITPADLVMRSAVHAAEPSAVARPTEALTVAGRPKTGEAFWTAFQARVRRINAGLEAKWRRTASR